MMLYRHHLGELFAKHGQPGSYGPSCPRYRALSSILSEIWPRRRPPFQGTFELPNYFDGSTFVIFTNNFCRDYKNPLEPGVMSETLRAVVALKAREREHFRRF